MSSIALGRPDAVPAKRSGSPDELAAVDAEDIENLTQQTAPQFTSTTSNKERPKVAIRTPQTNLAGLIHKPSTPLRRASSAGPLSSRRSTRRTSGTQNRTFGHDTSARLPRSRLAPVTTPHAIRALQQRRNAALTPGRDRRRSGRGQRDTPRDTLRNLSRILARETLPTKQSPSTNRVGSEKNNVKEGEDELDKDIELPRPRLSMRIDEEGDEDEGFYMAPPKLSISLEDDDDHTQGSVELPRRAVSERPYGKPSRTSFESLRSSDRFADLNELGLDAYSDDRGDDSLNQPDFGYGDDDLNLEEQPAMAVEDLPLASSAVDEQHHGRQTDIRPHEMSEEEDVATFEFNIPAISPPGLSPPRIGSSLEDVDQEMRILDVATDAGSKMYSMDRKSDRTKMDKVLKISKHGIQYPSLPVGVVKKVASRFARAVGSGKSKINRDTLGALVNATEWFFEQVGDDLGTFAQHAGRKTIDETDMITLMRRQRQVTDTTTPFSLAQKLLPRELLHDLRICAPVKLRPTGRSRRIGIGGGDDIHS
ncbi:MAG: hypothetical protein M1836_007834 [Candelina mexicana]|nr:MAG: hypothetical protein M1836_007834 [Candelina mexicana]